MGKYVKDIKLYFKGLWRALINEAWAYRYEDVYPDWGKPNSGKTGYTNG